MCTGGIKGAAGGFGILGGSCGSSWDTLEVSAGGIKDAAGGLGILGGPGKVAGAGKPTGGMDSSMGGPGYSFSRFGSCSD